MSDDDEPRPRITLIDELVARGAVFTQDASDHLAEWLVHIVEEVQRLNQRVQERDMTIMALQSRCASYDDRLERIEAQLGVR